MAYWWTRMYVHMYIIYIYIYIYRDVWHTGGRGYMYICTSYIYIHTYIYRDVWHTGGRGGQYRRVLCPQRHLHPPHSFWWCVRPTPYTLHPVPYSVLNATFNLLTPFWCCVSILGLFIFIVFTFGFWSCTQRRWCVCILRFRV